LPYAYELRRWLQNQRFIQHTKRKKTGRRFDIYHEPNILPLRFEGPTVITVHDLSWIRHPETHPVERVKDMNRHFESGLERANAIVTPSTFVKQELIDLFGVSAGQITPVPLGVEPLFMPLTSIQTQEVLDTHDLMHGHYFLTVGTLEPRKNLAFALQAYRQLPAKVRQVYPLVLIGMKGWKSSKIEQEISPLTMTGEVRQLGYVSRTELATLMAGACALIYPSIYEGFGLPPLESMACGVPVICANSTSLPEVVGDAGILIDPEDTDELARALFRIVEDDQLRAVLSLRSRQHAGQMTWSRCVESTLKVYRSIAL
jgi:alpha-1,3-rhamnosyl/mannosyltransferase